MKEFDYRNPAVLAQRIEETKDAANLERGKVTAAEAAVQAAESSLATAAERFKANPGTASATSKMVAEQILENAREAFVAAQQTAAPVLAEELRATQFKSFLEHESVFSKYEETRDALVAQVVTLESELRKIRGDLFRLVAEANERGSAARVLAGVLGVPTNAHGNRPGSDPIEAVQRGLRNAYFVASSGMVEAESLHNWIRLGSA